MREFIFLMMMAYGSIAMAGWGIPTPWNPVPLCNACACGDASACARDAADAARRLDEARIRAQNDAAELARKADAARLKAQEDAAKLVQAAKEKAQQQTNAVVKNIQDQVSDASQFLTSEVDRQKVELEATAKALKNAAKNPNLLKGISDAAVGIFNAKMETEKQRLAQALQILLKYNLMAQIKGKQVLIIVSELERWSDPHQRTLYHYIQTSGIPMAQSQLSQWYDQIVVIQTSQATRQNLLHAIAEATARDNIKAVDLFIFLHGMPDELDFYEGAVSTSQLAKDIRAIDTRGKLRMVYNTACYGATHIKDLLAAGFKVASGSIGVNSNAATEYPVVLQMLGLGQPFGLAVSLGNNPVSNAAWDEASRSAGNKDTNSQKNIGGNAAEGFLNSAMQWLADGSLLLQ